MVASGQNSKKIKHKSLRFKGNVCGKWKWKGKCMQGSIKEILPKAAYTYLCLYEFLEAKLLLTAPTQLNTAKQLN